MNYNLPAIENLNLAQALHEVAQLKIGPAGTPGWSPRLRQRFGYFTPDEVRSGLVSPN
jgi:hypothetical protein